MFTTTALLLSLPAHALSCTSIQVGATLPADGAVSVPVNALPTVELYLEQPLEHVQLELMTDEGVRVEAEQVVLTGGDPLLVQLQPVETLEEDREYAIVVNEVYGSGELFRVSEVGFRTGVDVDLEPPEDADIARVRHDVALDGEWGDVYDLRVHIDGGQDPSGAMFRIELSDDSDFSNPIERIRLASPALISHGLCTGDEAARLEVDDMWMRVTPIDVAGNTGTAAVREPVEDSDKEGGCNHISASQLGWLGVLMGLIGALRRSQ